MNYEDGEMMTMCGGETTNL